MKSALATITGRGPIRSEIWPAAAPKIKKMKAVIEKTAEIAARLGMKLGGHRLDEGAEAVDHPERREHREKRGKRDHPGPRRIRLGRQDARNTIERKDSLEQAGSPGGRVCVLGVSSRAHRYACGAEAESAASAASYSRRRRGGKPVRPDGQRSRTYNPEISRSVKCVVLIRADAWPQGAPPCNKDVTREAPAFI